MAAAYARGSRPGYRPRPLHPVGVRGERARDRRHRRSAPMPCGSAAATTRASTAEPQRARALKKAARRARRCGMRSTRSQALSRRFTGASRPGSPRRHSTSTGERTSGGHDRPARISAISAAVRGDDPARRSIAPESSISALNPRPHRPAGRCGRPGPWPTPCSSAGRLTDLGDQLGEVLVGGGESRRRAHLDPHGLLEQIRDRKAQLLHRLGGDHRAGRPGSSACAQPTPRVPTGFDRAPQTVYARKGEASATRGGAPPGARRLPGGPG